MYTSENNRSCFEKALALFVFILKPSHSQVSGANNFELLPFRRSFLSLQIELTSVFCQGQVASVGAWILFEALLFSLENNLRPIERLIALARARLPLSSAQRSCDASGKSSAAPIKCRLVGAQVAKIQGWRKSIPHSQQTPTNTRISHKVV